MNTGLVTHNRPIMGTCQWWIEDLGIWNWGLRVLDLFPFAPRVGSSGFSYKIWTLLFGESLILLWCWFVAWGWSPLIYPQFRRWDLVVGGLAQIGCQLPVVVNTTFVTWWICRLLEMGGIHTYSSSVTLSTDRWQLAHIIGMVLFRRAMAVQTSSATDQLPSSADWMVIVLTFGVSIGCPRRAMSM